MNTFDAIVIGSGMSGGWAAKELCQNPSLTYVAMTARAANFAVNELKKGNI